MGNQRKKRGRPLKNGLTKPEFFARSIMILRGYQEARGRGEKHSAAVREAVAFVRQLDPEMPISETEVKRVLADLQPRDNPVAMKVGCAVLNDEEATKRHFAQML